MRYISPSQVRFKRQMVLATWQSAVDSDICRKRGLNWDGGRPSFELPASLTFVLWKTDGERTVPDLLGEEVFLVEEEDDGGVDEPLVVADRVEELHALHHAVHLLVLGEHEVVAAERHAEDDGRHALEAVDPLLPLRPLTADVEHSENAILDFVRAVSRPS